MKVEIVRETEDQISELGLASAATSLVPAESVLLVMRSSILKHTLPVAMNAIPCALNQDMRAFDTRPHLRPRFLMRYLQGLNSSLLDAVVKQGATVESVDSDLIRRVQVPVPPTEEQIAICRYLDRETARIDALMEKKTRFIELLREKRQALTTQAVTQGLDPSAPLKDSGVEWLGSVPAHWEVLPLKALVSTPITDGPHETPDFIDDGVPFVSAEAVSQGEVDFSRIRGFISRADHERYSRKYSPRRGDVYMVKSGATTGVTAIVETDQEFNIWSPLAAIRPGPKIRPHYLLNFMRSRNFQEGVTLNWSFGTQQNIGMGIIGDLRIAVPPTSEQDQLLHFITVSIQRLDAVANKTSLSIELLRERRSALITAAVTGQIDVRKAA